MAFENAGKGSVEEFDKVTIPELEEAAKRVIDYAFQRLAEFAAKLGRTSQ